MQARLNQSNDMIERMEHDLVTKAQTAYANSGLTAKIHGVFSLDDLEDKEESDLCNGLAVGVGYAGAEAVHPKAPMGTAPGGAAPKMVDFIFHIILAVPHGTGCTERFDATRLLTALRFSILGTSCSADSTNRTWAFEKEFPNITDSTDTMLYYSQVWRLAMPVVGKV